MGSNTDNTDVFKNFTPRANPPRKAENIQDVIPININDPDALRNLAKEALVEIVQKAPRNVSLVAAIRELLDRIDGKAPQSIAMTVKQDPISKLTDDQLAMILANLPNNPMIIPPLPKKLSD